MCIRDSTDTVHYLDDLGVDLVSLANNHCYDFGETGLLDTPVSYTHLDVYKRQEGCFDTEADRAG